jgi:hypothetical protein
MSAPFQYMEPTFMSTPGQQPEPARIPTPAQHLESARTSTTVEDSEAPTEYFEPPPMPPPVQHPKPLHKSALIQRPEPLRMSSPALFIQIPRITSPTPPAPPPTPNTIHAHASCTPSTSATREALVISIQASLDRHNTSTFAQYTHANQRLRIRADHTRTVSAPLLSLPVSTSVPRADTRLSARTRAPPALNIRAPSASSTLLLARPNASASTISLLAGPRAYVYTPLTARAPEFESFRDDFEIESPRRQSAVRRAWERVKGGR